MESRPRQVAAKRREPPRAWQRMLSGRRLDLLNPAFTDVEIEDIAHGLARVARWNGQTQGDHAFSVAQHSVLVEELCGAMAPEWGPDWRLAALLHDAPEYVVGDMISPFKAALGLDYRAFEERLSAAIHVRFGLPVTIPTAVKTLIKKADRYSAYLEATQLAQFSLQEAQEFFVEPPAALHRILAPLSPGEAQAQFLARFAALQN